MLPATASVLVAGVAAVEVAGHVLSGTAATLVDVAGYAGLVAFAVIMRHRPGMLLVAVGLGANAAVIAADDGMPVKGAGSSLSGLHHGLTGADSLTGLADTIGLPGGIEVSPGDVVIAAGLLVVAVAWRYKPAGAA